MGICPGQAPMAMSPFCLLRVRNVPSEEDSASCEVLAGLIQSVIAISSAHYAFSSKLTLRKCKWWKGKITFFRSYTGDRNE